MPIQKVGQIHCAHCRQPYEIVLYHCLCSVQLSREVAQVMACFADFQSRRTPMLMCQSAEQLAGLGLPLTQHYLFHVNQQQLDRNLLEAIAAALKTTGTDISEQLQRVRREEQQAAGGKTNLLDFYYCSSVAKPLDSMWVLPVPQQITASDYYRAHWPSSDFVFVARAGADVSLELTCRLPDEEVKGAITLEVNGSSGLPVTVSGEWQSWEFTVPSDLLKDGLNEIRIHWPMPQFDQQKSMADAADQLLENFLPELNCIFGEIHSFVALQVPAAVESTPESQSIHINTLV